MKLSDHLSGYVKLRKIPFLLIFVTYVNTYNPYSRLKKKTVNLRPPKFNKKQQLKSSCNRKNGQRLKRKLYSEHLKDDGEQHPHTARTAFMLFQCLHRQEKTDLAQDILQSLRWIIEKDEGQIPNELRELRQILHQINESGSPNEDERTADEMLKKLSELVEEHGDTAPQVLQAKARTALHFANRGELMHAADLFASLHEYHLQQDGKQHPHTAFIAWNYFHCLQRQDKYDDARTIFETLSWVRELSNNELTEEFLGLRKQIDDYIESKAAENLKG